MEQVYRFLLNDLGLVSGDTVVVAVSGGPDSMALLSLLSTVKSEIHIAIVCAHVNHNVREESKEEKIFVENFCDKHNIIFEAMDIEDYGDDNFHNEARTKRYQYFGEIVEHYRAKYLFTAHHGDDLMETILMRLVRGSTLRGYSGFSKFVKMDNYIIVRPFIELTKDEIIDYDKKTRIPYVQDASNSKDVYTRNRFRKYIAPEFKKEDPNVHKKLYKFSQTLLEYNAYIDKQVEKIIPTVFVQNVIRIPEFLELDHVIGMKIIYSILEQFYQDDLMLITDRHAELIYSLIESKKANTFIYLPNGLKAIKTYDTLTFVIEEFDSHEYEIEIINTVNLPNGKVIETVGESSKTDNFVCRLNRDEIAFPIRVRTRKDGDKVALKGMLGRKKLNDIFTDKKINKQERDLWPIVVDSNDTIVWIPGLNKTKFDKTKEEKYDIILKYY